MTQKNLNIFSLAPPRLGGIDMLVPIFMKIKNENSKSNIVVFFHEHNCWKQLNRDPFLFDQFNKVVDKKIIFPDIKNKIFKKLFSGFFFFKIIFEILTHRAPYLIHSHSKKNLIINMIYFLVKLKNGFVFSHSNVLTILKKNKKVIKKKDLWKGDGIFCFGKESLENLKAIGHKNIYVIGYTRLYKIWLNTLKNDSKKYLYKEISNLNLKYQDPIITLFLPSTVPYIFDLDELFDWLKICIKVIRGEFPTINVLLKPHPQQKLQHLSSILKTFNDPRVKITHLHASLLASVSKIVISTDSSAIFDSMSLNIPTILFQKFTKHWLKVHPYKSTFLKLQPLLAENEIQLKNSIKLALSKNYNPPHITQILKHEENLDILTKN